MTPVFDLVGLFEHCAEADIQALALELALRVLGDLPVGHEQKVFHRL